MSAEDRAVSTGTTPAATDQHEESAAPSTDSEPTGEDDGGIALPLDQVFEMVKNERRRLTIDYLKNNPGKTSLGELSEKIAAIENDKPIKAITSKERKRVYVGLYQCHLPKMDDLDVIKFNKDRGWIELGPNAERLYPYVNMDEEGDDDIAWHKLYFGLAAITGATLVLATASGVVTDFLLLAITTTLIGIVGSTSIYQLLSESE